MCNLSFQQAASSLPCPVSFGMKAAVLQGLAKMFPYPVVQN